MRQRALFLLSFTFSCSVIPTAWSDDEAHRSTVVHKEWAVATLKLGMGLTSAAIAGSKSDFPPSDQPVSAQKQALMGALADYQRAMAKAQGHVQAWRTVADFTVNGTAAIMTSTGVGVVPAAIVKATGELATDFAISNFERQIKASVDVMLVKKKDQLLNVAGTTYENLRVQSPAQIKMTLENSSTVFADMEQLMAGNPKGIAMAKDLVVEGIINTQRASLEQLEVTQDRLGTAERNLGALAAGFVDFRDDTIEKLTAHETAINELQGAVGTLQISMAKVEKRLNTQERDGAIVADFVFAQMDPSVKVKSLEQGFLSERFTCPDGGTACEQAQFKVDLIERFRAEAEVQQKIAFLGETVQGLADVSQLASKLGIDIPGLDEAAGMANVAFNAYSQLAIPPPNILGAITTVSGLFKTRVDPDQARFEATMKFMRQQFEQVNKKLDQILINQQKLMDAIAALSEQVARQYRALDERLARMEFELERVSQGVRMLVWEDLAPCVNVHDYVRDNAKELHINVFGDFDSMVDIHKMTDMKGELVKNCMLIVNNKITTLGHANWFGNFLDVRVTMQYTPEIVPTEPGSEEFYSKSDLQHYIDAIHRPAVLLMSDLLERNKLPWSLALDRLAAPASRIGDTSKRLTTLTDGQQPCGNGGFLLKRMQPFVCGLSFDESPENKAFNLLSKPMMVEFSLDFADWMLIVSRMVDTLDQSAGGIFMTADQLLEKAKDPNSNFRAGYALVEDALRLLDLSIASDSMLYSDLAARAALDALHSKKTDNAATLAKAENARLLLKENSYLAANVAMILLRERYATTQGMSIQDAPSPTAYSAALNVAVATPSDPSLMLKHLFGNDLSFDIEPQGGRVHLKLADEVMVPMPEVNEFVQGKFYYPPRFVAMLMKREQLSERLADYDFYQGISDDQRASVANLISRKIN